VVGRTNERVKRKVECEGVTSEEKERSVTKD